MLFKYVIKDATQEVVTKAASFGETGIANINWETVVTATIASSFPIIIAIIGGAIIWGRYRERIDNHEERLDTSNGKLEKHDKKRYDLQRELEGMKQRCYERDNLWRRNNENHVEMFSRINALEQNTASMPGQLKDMIDERFKEWREVWQKDIKYTIYEIDREKANGINEKSNRSNG